MSSYTSEDINNTIRLINQDKRLLDMIMEVDGLLEHLGLYAYKNWQKGKIVEVGIKAKAKKLQALITPPLRSSALCFDWVPFLQARVSAFIASPPQQRRPAT